MCVNAYMHITVDISVGVGSCMCVLLRPSATVGLKCGKPKTTIRTESKAGDWRIFEP